MKKGCLIVVTALLGLLGAGGVGGYLYANKMLGISEAPLVSHKTEVTGDTRFILAVRPRSLDTILEAQAAAQIAKLAIPESIKNYIKGYINGAIPNEVAVIADFDDDAATLDATLFINERRFGPAMAMVTQDPKTYQLQWQGPPFQLPERGHLIAQWSYPYLHGVQDFIERNWTRQAGHLDMELEGNHLVEALLDNRDGEIFQALGVNLAQNNGTLAQLTGPPQSEKARTTLIKLVSDARLTLDRDDAGRLLAHLACNGHEESPSPLAMRYDTTSGPEVFEKLEQQMNAGRLDWKSLLVAAVEYLERFSLDWHFDNRQEAFMEVLGSFIDFSLTPELQNTGDQLKAVLKLMEEGHLTAAMLDNGDLAGEWKVMSHPDNAGTVYLTLCALLPTIQDQGLFFILRDLAAQLHMRLHIETAEMKEGASYLQRFTLSNFQTGLRDIVAGRVGMPEIHLPPPMIR